VSGRLAAGLAESRWLRSESRVVAAVVTFAAAGGLIVKPSNGIIAHVDAPWNMATEDRDAADAAC